MNTGFLSFVRLMGTAYFKSNLATLVSKLGFETPNQLYNSINPSLSDEEKHREWYLSIKREIRILHEDQRPPTITSLWRHWMRSCWIKDMWTNSPKPDLYQGLAHPESQGWLKRDSGYTIDWEDDKVLQQIQATLDFLDKGCTCKTGFRTKCCGCQKMGGHAVLDVNVVDVQTFNFLLCPHKMKRKRRRKRRKRRRKKRRSKRRRKRW